MAEDTKSSEDAKTTAPAKDEKGAAKMGKASGKKPHKAKSKGQFKKEAKSKLSKTAKIVLVIIGIAAMALSVTAMACSGIINQAANQEDYKLTGGVAATVNGMNIKEDTITKQIMSTRESAGKTKDKDWAQYLADQGLTPESYRESLIKSYANQYLLTQAEKEYDIKVTDEDVEEAWQNAAKSYGGEENFEKFLKQIGYDKDTYKQSLESSVAQQKLKDKVAPEKTPSDDEIVSYINENLSTYNDARRSENLLIKVDSDASEEDDAKAKATAQEALDKINSGELSFEDAVKQYSEDDGSKEKSGDVGWDKLTSFVTEYQNALSQLSKGQVSGLVKTEYGYHIIKCTDVFHVDDKVTSIDQIPSEIREKISDTVKSNNASNDYSKWLQEYQDKADIKINDMPDGLPYDVDMTGIKASSGSGSSAN